MKLGSKLAVFATINLAIAGLAATAPASLVGGRPYDAVTLIFDTIDGLDVTEPVSVILGDSRSECCLAAAELGFLNLSLEGTTPVEGYYLLNYMLERGLKVERMVLSYGPFHVFTQDIFHARTKQFGLFDEDFVRQVDAEAQALGDPEYAEYHWPALQKVDTTLPWLSERTKFALIRVLSLNETVISILRTVRLGQISDLDDENPKLHEIVAAERINNQARSPEAEKPQARSPVNEHYLAALAELGERHGIARTYLVMPFNAFVEQPPAEYFERFDRTIEAAGFAACYSGRREWPNEFFSDSGHLNRVGAERLHAELERGLPYC